MRALGVLLGKELHATFTSPIAYAVATVFLVVLGYTFSLTLFFTKVANLTYIFHQMYVLLILLVPVLTMRAFADERRTGTLNCSSPRPWPTISIVLAKFLASFALVLALRRLAHVRLRVGAITVIPTGVRSTEATWPSSCSGPAGRRWGH